jgi:hypothetical protein
MKAILVIFTVIALLFSGCLKTAEVSKIDREYEKNALIAKYEGKLPVNNWEPADKKRFLELIK